jgi:hypothetical protein
MDALYNYVIHFNFYTELWAAMPRESVRDYFNGVKNENILFNKTIEGLIKDVKKKNEQA